MESVCDVMEMNTAIRTVLNNITDSQKHNNLILTQTMTVLVKYDALWLSSSGYFHFMVVFKFIDNK